MGNYTKCALFLVDSFELCTYFEFFTMDPDKVT